MRKARPVGVVLVVSVGDEGITSATHSIVQTSIVRRARTTIWPIASLEELPRLPLDFRLIVLDLENTLLAYRATAEDVATMRLGLSNLISALPARSRIIIATNKVRCDAAITRHMHDAQIQLIERCRKPSTKRIVHELHGAIPTLVVGDQVLTDGLLARNLCVPFVEVVGCSSREPLWPTLMRSVGRVAAVSLFRCASEGLS